MTMKPFILLATIFLSAMNLQARGPWTEYWEVVPSAGTPAAVATTYVKLANQKDYESCRSLMTEDYEAWLERLGGIAPNLAVFANANLEKRFAWRELTDGNKATVWLRIYNVERGREVNVALNLITDGDGWKLTI